MVILLTGASSGIGLQAARRLSAMGHVVYGAARRSDLIAQMNDERIHAVRMDITDEQEVVSAVGLVMRKEGRIDALVNNAGYGSFGPVECVPIDEAKRQLDVNLIGLARLTQLVIPIMRRQGGGRIVNISSVAGHMTTYMGAWYHVSKYAVEALSDALRMELEGFGVKVSIVEPGVIGTDWGPIAADHLEACTQGTDYAAEGKRVTGMIRRLYGSCLPSKPDVVARAICKALTDRRPRARYHAGVGSPGIVWLHALLPARVFDRWVKRVM